MSLNIQTSRIFIQDPIHAGALGEIYVCEDPAQIAKNGHLFILINLLDPQPDYEQFVGAFLEKTIHTYYYAVLEDSTKLLEYTLNELNQWLPENLPAHKKILNNLNLVIGNLKDNILNIAYIGEWQGYLIHPAKAIDVFGEYKKNINPVKLFENVITGKLDGNNSFMITNASLLDYLSMDKIRKIVSTIPARSAAEQLKNMISNAPVKVSFLSVIIKKASENEVANEYSNVVKKTAIEPTPNSQSINYQQPASTAVKSRESLDHLISTQNRTAKIMSVPSSWQTISSTAQDLKEKFISSNIAPLLTSVLKKIGSYIWTGLKFLGGALLFISIKLKRIIISLIKPGHMPNNSRRRSLSDLNIFSGLSLKNKIISLIIIILVITLSSLIFLPNNTEPKLSTEEFNQIQTEFTTKQEAIEAALIYGDRIRAQSLLDELLTLIQRLPISDGGNDQPTYDDLRTQSSILTERIWNIFDIADPIVLQTSTEQSLFTNVIADGDNIYTFNNNKQFTKYNFNDKSIATGEYPENLNGISLTAYAPDLSILVIDNNKQFFRVNNTQLNPVLISLSAGLKSIAAATSFFNRLYLLDSETDQIYRHRSSGATFQAPDLWLRDNIDMAGAKDIAIDGFVYILKDNKIIKLSSGRQESFPDINIYPALNNPTKLYTNVETNNLYLLDPENNRLIVLDKEGNLVKQYHSDKWQNLKDFSIQEEAKRAFLITDKELFVVPL